MKQKTIAKISVNFPLIDLHIQNNLNQNLQIFLKKLIKWC